MTSATGFRYKPGVCTAAHGSALVLLDLESETYFSLDEIGTRVWTLMGQGYATTMIVEQLAHEYAVPVDRVGSDVRNLLDTLLHLNLIMRR